MLRALVGTLLVALLASPAAALADHGIASAVRSSGEPLSGNRLSAASAAPPAFPSLEFDAAELGRD